LAFQWRLADIVGSIGQVIEISYLYARLSGVRAEIVAVNFFCLIIAQNPVLT
jgi:hypothetical protein